jgi:HK97 gp10 family phage protein
MIQKVEVEGIDQLIKDFRHFGKEADKAVKRGVDRTALAVETDAKEKLKSDGHVRTRRLLQSIHTETKEGTKYYYEASGASYPGSLNEKMQDDESIVGTNVHYAPYVEFGTKFMSGDSYLGYAAVKQDKKLRDRIIEELNKLIKR